jgi:sugar lactone lactonase YvrE/enterochelin esterase-like enzyme
MAVGRFVLQPRLGLAIVAGAIVVARLAGAADPWPQWRGPEGQGHAPEAHDLPVTWSEREHVRWKTPLPGRGWSSPVIGGGLVWMTTAIEQPVSEEERRRRLVGNTGDQPLTVSGPVSLRALGVDAESGRLVHDVELVTVPEPQPIHALNSFASPSPVLAGNRLYCHWGDFGTACLDTETARVVWTSRGLRLNHENGPGSTPVLWKDRLIVHADGSDTQSIAAFDAATGTIAWQTPRSGALHDDPQHKKAYGTPLLLPLGGRDVVVSPAADWIYGYDPATGRELWKLSYGRLGFSIVPRPVFAHGLMFMSTSFNQPELLALRLGDGAAAPEIVWRETRGVPTMPSPLVVGDVLYMVSEKGIASCLEARTGKPLWAERLPGNFSSSPFHADGRIYVGSREGKTYVLRPGRKAELLATNELDGAIFATPAAVGRAVFLRTDTALYRIEKPEPRAAAAVPEPPRGELLAFQFADSRIFPGTVREVRVYVPAQHDGRTPACVHVNQDGVQFDAPRVFDRLIHERRMPVTVGVFVKPGRVPATRPGALDRYNRSLEYDGLGPDYARFLLEELLPAVETKTTSDGRKIVLSKHGNDRSIGGTSSGAIAAFTAAWERPDAFTRVFSGIGTYVGLRGGDDYATLVRKVEPKPIRVFLQDGSADLDNFAGDWWMANQALERSLSFAGYEVRHAWGAGRHNAAHATEVFPAAMEWLWSEWPRPVGTGQGSPQLRAIIIPDEGWRLVGAGFRSAAGAAVNARGEVFFDDVAAGKSYRVTPDWKAEVWQEDSHGADAQAFAADGRLVATGAADAALVARDADGKTTALVRGWRANDVTVTADARIYATEPGRDEQTPSRIHLIEPAGTDAVVAEVAGVADGLCLSPDQTLLYVADASSHWVWSFTIRPDGTLANKQRFFHLHVPDTADDAGIDGMQVDRDGRLWVATRMGIQVCDQIGRVTCIIPVPHGRCADLCFGGPDFDHLVACCGDKVFVRRVKPRGAASFLPPVTPAKPSL